LIVYFCSMLVAAMKKKRSNVGKLIAIKQPVTRLLDQRVNKLLIYNLIVKRALFVNNKKCGVLLYR